jgi:hypothetical protein
LISGGKESLRTTRLLLRKLPNLCEHIGESAHPENLVPTKRIDRKLGGVVKHNLVSGFGGQP